MRREGVVQRSESRRGNESRNSGSTIERRGTYRAPEATTDRNNTETRTWNRSDNRSSDRNRNSGTWNRNDNRNRDSRNSGTWNRGSNNNRSYGSRSDGRYYGNRQTYYHRGRVTRYSPWNGGYRVWVAGAPYPFYVPLAYWNANRFRIGLTIGLGGYYNDLGYYDYYDGYRDGYYDSYRTNPGYRGNSDADFRGTVESVNRRGDSFVVRNEATGSFITVVLRDRREGTPRVGDFVAVRGDWTSSGYFRAYDVDFLDSDYGDRRY